MLSALRIAGPPHHLSPSRLGRGLMMSSAGVTSRTDRLERRALVRRLPDPHDRRGVIVELTDEGLEAVDAAVRRRDPGATGAAGTLRRNANWLPWKRFCGSSLTASSYPSDRALIEGAPTDWLGELTRGSGTGAAIASV